MHHQHQCRLACMQPRLVVVGGNWGSALCQASAPSHFSSSYYSPLFINMWNMWWSFYCLSEIESKNNESGSDGNWGKKSIAIVFAISCQCCHSGGLCQQSLSIQIRQSVTHRMNTTRVCLRHWHWHRQWHSQWLSVRQWLVLFAHISQWLQSNVLFVSKGCERWMSTSERIVRQLANNRIESMIICKLLSLFWLWWRLMRVMRDVSVSVGYHSIGNSECGECIECCVQYVVCSESGVAVGCRQLSSTIEYNVLRKVIKKWNTITSIRPSQPIVMANCVSIAVHDSHILYNKYIADIILYINNNIRDKPELSHCKM